MNELEEKIKEGLKHFRCADCNNELAIVFGSLFGDKYKKIKGSGIKYKSGCCFDNEYYYCDKCHKYFDKKFKNIDRGIKKDV